MIKMLLSLSFAIFLFSCMSSRTTAKINHPTYEVIADTQTKVLKGYLNRSVLENDTAFKWFAENIKYGTADTAAVRSFHDNKANFSLVVVGGTWCHDTQNLLPVFYRLIDKSGFPENKITLIGVDRDKKGPEDLEKNYSIVSVPTFIVMKNGKEVGRVVEYGKEGQIDKELGEIVAKAASSRE